MDLVEDCILPYVDIKSILSLRCCNSLKFGTLKFKVAIIEKWWKNIILKRWIYSVCESVNVLCHVQKNLKCNICKNKCTSDAVFINSNLIFTCHTCFQGLSIDIYNEIYPLKSNPYHTAIYTCSQSVPVYWDSNFFNNEIDYEALLFDTCRNQ